MSTLANSLTVLADKDYRVLLEGKSFSLNSVISSRKIILHSKSLSKYEFHVGQVVTNIILEHRDNLKHLNSGVISRISVSENVVEIGLFHDLEVEVTESEEMFGEITPFKADFKYENSRKSKRVNIRREDAVELTVKCKNLDLTVKPFDLSSFGFSFISDSKFDFGTEIGFELNIRDGDFSGQGEITWVQEINGQFKTGVKFLRFHNVDPFHEANQIVIKHGYHVHGIYSKINFYLERSEFKILSLSSKSFVLQVEKTGQYLLPGMKLDLKFFISTSNFENTILTNATISFVNNGPNGSLIVGCNVKSLSESLSLNLANYLLQFLEVSPDEVRAAGFNVSKIADVFTFRYVETHADYIEVLKLRYEAYLDAGKVDRSKKPANMAATLDSKSRILMVKHQGKLIASVAISFPDSNDLILDTEKALAGGYSKEIPEKIKMVEIARLCTHPEYRKGDLLHRVFEHVYKIFVTSGREYIITSCDDKLWPLYSKLGFRKTGLQYNHIALSGLLHHIIIGSTDICVKLNKMNWIAWSYLFGGMYKELDSKNLVTTSKVVRAKMYAGSLLLDFVTAITKAYLYGKKRTKFSADKK